MQGYKKVVKDKAKTVENEIRITSKGQIKKYLGYALRVLNKTDHREVLIKATGNAIVKALILIEIVKRRHGDLHQINEIKSMEIVDEYEPMTADLPKTEQKRRVTCLDCILSKDPLDESNVGYQPPQKKEIDDERPPREERPHRHYNNNTENRGGRGGYRGNRGRDDAPPRGFNDRPQRPRVAFNEEGGDRPRGGFNNPDRPHNYHRGGRGFNDDQEGDRREARAPLNIIHSGNRGGGGAGPRANDDSTANVRYNAP
jgi:DNA-binding protein